MKLLFTMLSHSLNRKNWWFCLVSKNVTLQVCKTSKIIEYLKRRKRLSTYESRLRPLILCQLQGLQKSRKTRMFPNSLIVTCVSGNDSLFTSKDKEEKENKPKLWWLQVCYENKPDFARVFWTWSDGIPCVLMQCCVFCCSLSLLNWNPTYIFQDFLCIPHILLMYLFSSWAANNPLCRTLLVPYSPTDFLQHCVNNRERPISFWWYKLSEDNCDSLNVTTFKVRLVIVWFVSESLCYLRPYVYVWVLISWYLITYVLIFAVG